MSLPKQRKDKCYSTTPLKAKHTINIIICDGYFGNKFIKIFCVLDYITSLSLNKNMLVLYIQVHNYEQLFIFILNLI